MAETVNIATLKIDFDDVITKSATLKSRIDDLKKSQKELDTTTLEGQKAFAKQDAEIRNLNQSYRDNQRFAAALETANKDLTRTLDTENKSTQELRESRSALNQISKQLERSEGELTGNIEEEKALRQQLNTAIDAQTEKLREQSSTFNASKDGIGEYQQGFKAAFDEINIFNGGLSGLTERARAAGGVGALVKASFIGMAQGIGAATKASLAFIATPVGVILAAIAAAALLVRNALNRSESSTQKISKAFAGFRGIANKLLAILEPLGEFLIDGLVKGFELVESAVFAALTSIEQGLRAVGFEEAANSVRGFSASMAQAAEESRQLADAQAGLEASQRNARRIQLEFQKDAEKLRQIRDDENLSIRERIQANDDLGQVLKNQLTTELGIAQQALTVANLRIKAEGETKETLDAQADALTEIADIQERVTSQESEQLTNRVSLQKEALEKQKEYAEKQKQIQDEALEVQKDALDLFIQEQGIRAKTLAEQLAESEAVAQKQIEILDKELEQKKISLERYNAEVLSIENDLLAQRAELAVENARRELDAVIERNESRLDVEKFLSEELYNEEIARLELIAQANRDFEAKRLEEGVINRNEYNSAINAIDEENRLNLQDLENERREVEAERDAIDFENRLAVYDTRADIETQRLTEQLERERQLEIQAAEKTGADVAAINEKYAVAQKEVEKRLQQTRLQGYSMVLDGVAEIFGKQTALGKAAAIAQASINTFQGATLALATYPPPLGPILAGVTIAAGLVQVAKIASTDDSFALGGILDGPRHSQGGIQTRFGNLEGGEAVINRKSTQMFAPLLSDLNVAGGGRRFAFGGVMGDSLRPSGGGINGIVDGFRDAVLQMPPGVVSVEEIVSVADKVVRIKETGNF